MKKILLSISILFSISASANWPSYLPKFWATYYISPSGNDVTGDGTIGSPWASLYKATATVTGVGDIIHVNAGTYTETQTCLLAPGVSIEGDGVTSVIKATMSTLYVRILDLVSATMGTDGNQHVSNIKFDGSNLLTSWGIFVGGRSNVSIHDVTIVDFKDYGLVVNGRPDGSPIPPSVYATGNTIYNCTINNCATYNGNGTGCFNFGGQIGMLLHDNIITQTQRPSGQNGWPIKYFSEGFSRGCKIYNNTLTKIPFQNDGWAFCAEIFNTQGLEMYGNTIQGSLDFNYQEDRGTYPYVVWIHDNIFSQPALSSYNEDAIVFEYGIDSAIIEDNTFTNINQAISFYPRPGTILRGLVVKNNLFTNMGAIGQAGGYLGHFIGGFNGAIGNSWSIINWEIYNNTFISTTTAGAKAVWGLEISTSGTEIINNLKFKNNIIDGISGFAMFTQDKSKFINCAFQYNDFYGTQNDALLIPPDRSVGIAFPGSTIESNNLATVNPLYVGGGNFTLQSGSTLINAGTDVGLPFNGGAPDIGYAEYVSATNPVANAGADTTVYLPITSFTITGTAADPDGTVASVAWSRLSGPAVTIINGTTLSPALSGITTDGLLLMQLLVTDNLGNTNTDTRIITVNVADTDPPTVVSTNPANGAAGVNPNSFTVIISFNEAVKTTVGTVTGIAGGVLQRFSTYFSYTGNLAPSTTYILTVSAVEDVAGNVIAAPYVFSFTTGATVFDPKVFFIKGL